MDELLVLIDPKKLFQPQFKKKSIPCSKCNQFLSKYSCPKCKKEICSLACYRNHDQSCTTAFDTQTQKDSMMGKKASFDEEIQMKKTLGRLYREMGEESILPLNQMDEVERFEELLKKSEEGTIELSELSQREQQDFGEFIQELRIEEAWIPFWEIEQQESLYVEELDDLSNSSNSVNSTTNRSDKSNSELRNKMNTIIAFKKLCCKEHADLANHLINIIGAMALTFRYFNGEWMENSEEFCQTLLQTSYSLRETKATTLGSIELSYQRLKDDSKQLSLIPFKEDLLRILKNKYYVIDLLFKGYDVFHKLEQDQQENKQILRQIHVRKQKLIYYISYALSKNEEFYRGLREYFYG